MVVLLGDQNLTEEIKKIMDEASVAYNTAQERYETGKEAQRGELRNQIKHNSLAKDHVLALPKKRLGDCTESEISETDWLCEEQEVSSSQC